MSFSYRKTNGLGAQCLGKNRCRTVLVSQSEVREPEAQRRVKISFRLPHKVRFGQNLCLVGSGTRLGEWDVTRAVRMTWSDGDVWRADLDVDMHPEKELQYKYVVRNADGGVATWKPGENIALKWPVDEDVAEIRSMRILDAWDGSHRDVKWEVAKGKDGQNEARITSDERIGGGLDSRVFSREEEVAAVVSAMRRAFTELDELMESTLEYAERIKDPADPGAVMADREVAASARKALALSRAVEAAKDAKALEDRLNEGSEECD